MNTAIEFVRKYAKHLYRDPITGWWVGGEKEAISGGWELIDIDKLWTEL